jgi:hypothetical protein
MSEQFTIRRATPDDIDMLVELRNAMLREAADGGVLGDVSEALGKHTRLLRGETTRGRIRVLPGGGRRTSRGVGGVVLFRKPALPQSPLGLEGYIFEHADAGRVPRKGHRIGNHGRAAGVRAGSGGRPGGVEGNRRGAARVREVRLRGEPGYMQLKL